MAARAWVAGLIGLFVAWIVLQFLSGMIGTIWGVYSMLNETGIVDPEWDRQVAGIKQAFLGVWDYMPFIVFASFIVYIIIESMRRRPEEYYY